MTKEKPKKVMKGKSCKNKSEGRPPTSWMEIMIQYGKREKNESEMKH